MSDDVPKPATDDFDQLAHNALRLGLIFVIIYWCFQIVVPFLPLVIWGGIIAIATYPLHANLSERLGGRVGLSATIVTLGGLTVLIAPMVVLTESLVESSSNLARSIADGTLAVPPPPESVEELPLIGERLYLSWALGTENLGAALERFKPQIEALSMILISTAAGAGAAFLELFFSVIVAGALLAAKEKTITGIRSVMDWLIGDRGAIILDVSHATVRSVFRGVLGVAIIETILASIGLVIADVPAAGLWALAILVLSIAQIPPLLVLVPLAVYVVSTAGAVPAVVFIVLSVLVVLVDTFLKPVLLGRSADTPMLIILIGALGGMVLAGIVGLFVGAVVMVLGWELLQFWIHGTDEVTSGT